MVAADAFHSDSVAVIVTEPALQGYSLLLKVVKLTTRPEVTSARLPYILGRCRPGIKKYLNLGRLQAQTGS